MNELIEKTLNKIMYKKENPERDKVTKNKFYACAYCGDATTKIKVVGTKRIPVCTNCQAKGK